MRRLRVIEVTRTNLPEHPAVQAWRRLDPARAGPDAVERLQQTRKASIYRLRGAGPAGTAVIAKRCEAETARIEQRIYEEVLPVLPMRTLRCFGTVADLDIGTRVVPTRNAAATPSLPIQGHVCGGKGDAGFCWLFLEDAGDEWYSAARPAHHTALTRWLAAMHAAAARLPAAAQLPDRGAAFYLDQLRLARDDILAHLGHPALKNGDLALFQEILAACDFLESRWSCLEEFCRKMPPTLVHGDLKAKNLRVRRAGAGVELLPFDWEIAGWGTAATDLLRCPDLGLYWSCSAGRWPDLSVANLEQLAMVGKIFRALIAINWECVEYWECLAIRYEWVKWPAADLALYRRWLTEAIRALDVS